MKYATSSSFNIKLGYCYFDYAFNNGEIAISVNDIVVENYTNLQAKSKMNKGFMGELNLGAGNKLRFSLGLMYRYFLTADYNISYIKEEVLTSAITSYNETGELSAHSVRVKPEISFLPLSNLRFFVNLTLAATLWEGEDTSMFDDLKSYPGVDTYAGLGAGIRYYY